MDFWKVLLQRGKGSPAAYFSSQKRKLKDPAYRTEKLECIVASFSVTTALWILEILEVRFYVTSMESLVTENISY